MLQKCQVRATKFLDSVDRLLQLAREDGKYEGAGVVVRSVALAAVGNVKVACCSIPVSSVIRCR